MNFVLDASIALSWCFQDEATDATMTLLRSLECSTAYVPELWSLEVGNILISAEKKHRISYAKIAEFLALIENLSIEVDHETSIRGFREILSLAHSEKLTTYDAAYLELAMRLGIPLATKDHALQNAAKKVGIECLN